MTQSGLPIMLYSILFTFRIPQHLQEYKITI